MLQNKFLSCLYCLFFDWYLLLIDSYNSVIEDKIFLKFLLYYKLNKKPVTIDNM
jgi:hypothetical protein